MSPRTLVTVTTMFSLLLPANAGGAAGLYHRGVDVAPTPATQAGPVISITDTVLEPAVVVVPLGSEVTWRNDGKRPHAIVGPFWASPDLQPGVSYTVRFTRFGEFRYADRLNPAVTGTVVVLAGGRSTPRGRGSAEHRYRATVSLTVQESWEFFDGLFLTTKGPCNAQVGGGRRDVAWSVRLPDVTYSRNPRFGLELLSTKSPANARLRVFREQQQSKIADGGRGPFTPRCPNGTVGGFSAVHDADCSTNVAGRPLKITIAWSPKVAAGRFFVHNDGPRFQFQACGPRALTRVDAAELPLDLRGWNKVPYDTASALATKANVDRLRRGLPVRVDQKLDLVFTVDCCAGFNPRTTPPTGNWAVTGAVFRFRARLVINLTPR